jgi:hypothetical protein
MLIWGKSTEFDVRNSTVPGSSLTLSQAANNYLFPAIEAVIAISVTDSQFPDTNICSLTIVSFEYVVQPAKQYHCICLRDLCRPRLLGSSTQVTVKLKATLYSP